MNLSKMGLIGLAGLSLMLGGCGDSSDDSSDDSSGGSGGEVSDECYSGEVVGTVEMGGNLETDLPEGEKEEIDGTEHQYPQRGFVHLDVPVGETITYDITPTDPADDLAMTLLDASECTPVAADRDFNAITRVTHQRQEGEELVLDISKLNSTVGTPEDQPLNFGLDAVEGTIVEPFCSSHDDQMSVGTAQSGSLEAYGDRGGPEGNDYASYAIELEAGQTYRPDFSHDDNVIMKAYVYTPDCVHVFPPPALDMNQATSVFEATETGTYSVVVTDYNPTGGDFEVAIEQE